VGLGRISSSYAMSDLTLTYSLLAGAKFQGSGFTVEEKGQRGIPG
jgi:hypothetical protein